MSFGLYEQVVSLYYCACLGQYKVLRVDAQNLSGPPQHVGGRFPIRKARRHKGKSEGYFIHQHQALGKSKKSNEHAKVANIMSM